MNDLVVSIVHESKILYKIISEQSIEKTPTTPYTKNQTHKKNNLQQKGEKSLISPHWSHLNWHEWHILSLWYPIPNKNWNAEGNYRKKQWESCHGIPRTVIGMWKRGLRWWCNIKRNPVATARIVLWLAPRLASSRVPESNRHFTNLADGELYIL